jgi:hypothetical protein
MAIMSAGGSGSLPADLRAIGEEIASRRIHGLDDLLDRLDHASLGINVLDRHQPTGRYPKPRGELFRVGQPLRCDSMLMRSVSGA